MKRFNPSKQYFSSLLTAYSLLLTVVVFSTDAFAGVTIFDTVSTVNKETKLKALTTGRVFPEGGKLVTYNVDDRDIGTTLSGGDGYAFMKYQSSSRGIKILKVKSGDDTDEGVLLITGKKDKVILIAIESTLFQSIMKMEPSESSKDALLKISKKFRIIYLTRMMGMSVSRVWIKKHALPVSAVLKWEGAETLSGLHDRDVEIFAIIGPSDILSDASDVKKRFSFEDTEAETVVKDWDELIEKLK